MTRGSQKVIEALNQDLRDELAAIFQYMWHHFQGEGLEAEAILPAFSDASLDEMRHAEKLAERIVYLGGTPDHQPSTVKFGGDLKKMIADDLEAENRAAANYKAHIELAAGEGDLTTRRMLEELLADEEGHADRWETLLGAQ